MIRRTGSHYCRFFWGKKSMNLKDYEEKTEEMTVRISWAQDSKDIHEPCAKARFDQAVFAGSDQVITFPKACILEWPVTKKLFGVSPDHHLKKGMICRIHARRKKKISEVSPETWLLEELLEKNVRDERLDPLLQFENGYETEEKKMIFLAEHTPYGAAVVFDYLRIGVSCLAFIDENDVLHHEYVNLSWMGKENRRSSFKPETLCAYSVLARKHKTDKNRYLAVRILKKENDSRFAEIIEAYKQPVVITNEYGTFTLNRPYRQYEGEIAWPNGEASVTIDASEDGTASFKMLEEICRDRKQWDESIRTSAAESLLETAEDWAEEEISLDELMKLLGIPSIHIISDEEAEVFYEPGELFGWHTVIVDIDHGSVSDAYLAG